MDLIELKGLAWDEANLGTTVHEIDIPDEMMDMVAEYREKLIETVVEWDDDLLAKYFDGIELSGAEINAGLRSATLSGRVVPILCGSALKNKGVQPLLDAIVSYLPSPTDVPPIKALNPETQAMEERLPNDDEPFCALAFKIMTDPHVGKLTFLRVYSGVLTRGANVYNSARGKRERIGRLMPNACQQARGTRCGLRRRHRRGDWSQGYRHR